MKTLKNIFFSSLGIISVALFVYLANDIYQENERVQRIKGVDAKVIDQLKKIRTAQEAFLSQKKTYANSWDSLFKFLQEEQFVLLQRKETVTIKDGKDFVKLTVDTLGTISVFDSLKVSLKMNELSQVTSLNKVPVSDTIFTIRADELGNGQKVCEIRDPQPLNPRRQKNGDLKPLQIGSLEMSTLQGNWE